MTDTPTERVDEDATTPFVEDDREIAYRSEATPQVSHGPSGRPALVAPAAGGGGRPGGEGRERNRPPRRAALPSWRRPRRPVAVRRRWPESVSPQAVGSG